MKLLLFIILLTCNTKAYSQVPSSHKCGIDSIFIARTGWDVLQDVSVTCTQFEKQNYPLLKVYRKETINNISSIINTAKEEIKNPINDFRCKIYSFRNDTLISSICCNKYNVLIDGLYFKTPETTLS